MEDQNCDGMSPDHPSGSRQSAIAHRVALVRYWTQTTQPNPTLELYVYLKKKFIKSGTFSQIYLNYLNLKFIK